ncbi:Piso0_005018 [Millerozyma farinosa CBS 7064]|uniref:DNA damage-inducible protein 1 n=1 Tax=Pichia sorbitophila (strain ATCC MYA-4447 / BCRC 22081 / CBS 7064 / NBRC 10061 / NRRL Y-12695) TaxID=559304 RepID=G8Y404_PICSO|nr:Piso0_005018 [Millerozyma farinosa CBS 7064]
MKLTVSNELNSELLAIDIPDSLSLQDFQAYLQAETNVPPHDQVLKHDGHVLSGASRTLAELGIKDNDLVVLNKGNMPSTSTSSSGTSMTANSSSSNGVDFQIESMRQQFLNNPQLRNHLQQSNPTLASLLDRPESFKSAVVESLQQFQSNGQLPGNPGAFNPDELRRLQENPDDPENQAKILEMIRQEQVEENMQLAYDISPESFTTVNMLYINIKVNGTVVQAFVDSGAQSTIISPKLAEKCGISRLVDKRFIGEARGVGSQKIEGKIHSVPISIDDSDAQIPCSFIVIDTHVDLLFGLDMLRRHRCVIDLQRDKLVVGGNVETSFLHESEIESNVFGSPMGLNAPGSSGTRLGSTSNAAQNNNVTSSLVPANSTPGPDKKSPTRAAADAASRRHGVPNTENKFKEDDIKQLISLGFSRQEAIFALEQSQGNVEMAASLLFQ